MSLLTLPAFLVGNRNAILDLAATRWSLLVGGLFVLSAGLAREYDGADLLHEPWHLLIPFGASVVACAVLCFFILLRAMVSLDWTVRFFLSLLGLFWMTAPLAWLYAIPFERFLNEQDAVRANYWCLAIVAVWRVALITRVLIVLTDCSPWAAVPRVGLFATGSLWVLSWANLSPDLFNLMSGSRTPPEEELQQLAALVSCCVSLPLTLAFIVFALAVRLPSAVTWPWLTAKAGRPPGLIAIALAAVLIWLPILPFTQDEQWNRWTAENLWDHWRHQEAVAYMSARQAGDFPPHWQPPPRQTPAETWPPKPDPEITAIAEVLEMPRSAWVTETYLARLAKCLGKKLATEELHWDHQIQVDLGRIAMILEKQPEGRSIAQKHLEITRRRHREMAGSDPGSTKENDATRGLVRLMKLAEEQ